MARDRFVYWLAEAPSIHDIQRALEDYLGAAGDIAADGFRFVAWLTGTSSHPMRRILPHDTRVRAFAEQASQTRAFEVIVADDHLDVITRMGDEYTNVVAEGFAAFAARYWRGRRAD
jgi:hypothetical protein